VNGFKLKSNLSLLEKNCKKITFIFSKNDDVVPLEHAKKYRKKLKNVKIIVYNNIKGHFKISEFPELVKMIKKDVK
jgi:predicted alpha/beta hydrolase family esterase